MEPLFFSPSVKDPKRSLEVLLKKIGIFSSRAVAERSNQCPIGEGCANALFGTSSKEELRTVQAIFTYRECLKLAGTVWSGEQSGKNRRYTTTETPSISVNPSDAKDLKFNTPSPKKPNTPEAANPKT